MVITVGSKGETMESSILLERFKMIGFEIEVLNLDSYLETKV